MLLVCLTGWFVFRKFASMHACIDKPVNVCNYAHNMFMVSINALCTVTDQPNRQSVVSIFLSFYVWGSCCVAEDHEPVALFCLSNSQSCGQPRATSRRSRRQADGRSAFPLVACAPRVAGSAAAGDVWAELCISVKQRSPLRSAQYGGPRADINPPRRVVNGYLFVRTGGVI